MLQCTDNFVIRCHRFFFRLIPTFVLKFCFHNMKNVLILTFLWSHFSFFFFDNYSYHHENEIIDA